MTLDHYRVTSQQSVLIPRQFSVTHLYTWVEDGNVRVRCLALDREPPGPLDPESRAFNFNHD